MSVVIDASAVLAVLFAEPGTEVASGYCRGAMLSAVTLIEVREKFARRSGTAEPVAGLLDRLGIEIVPFTEAQAVIAADLKQRVGKNDSLADRICLALAIERGLPVVSADRRWAELDIGVDLRLIR